MDKMMMIIATLALGGCGLISARGGRVELGQSNAGKQEEVAQPSVTGPTHSSAKGSKAKPGVAELSQRELAELGLRTLSAEVDKDELRPHVRFWGDLESLATWGIAKARGQSSASNSDLKMAVCRMDQIYRGQTVSEQWRCPNFAYFREGSWHIAQDPAVRAAFIEGLSYYAPEAGQKAWQRFVATAGDQLSWDEFEIARERPLGAIKHRTLSITKSDDWTRRDYRIAMHFSSDEEVKSQLKRAYNSADKSYCAKTTEALVQQHDGRGFIGLKTYVGAGTGLDEVPCAEAKSAKGDKALRALVRKHQSDASKEAGTVVHTVVPKSDEWSIKRTPIGTIESRSRGVSIYREYTF